MHSLTSWFIRNPVAANLIMLLIIISGLFTLSSIRIEGFPKIPADTIMIETEFFGGAYAQRVDQQITQKVEKALEGLQGIKKIHATSFEGYSRVAVQKKDGYNLQKLLDDIRIRLDSVRLPLEAERPIISRNDFNFPALFITVHGDTDKHTLQRLGKQIHDELLSLAEVSKIDIWGEMSSQIRIEARPGVLEKYDLTIRDLIEKIQQSSLIYNAGELKTKNGLIALRADNQAYKYQDFAEIPILDLNDGRQILLGELCSIQDTYDDDQVIVRFNGQPAYGMQVLIGRHENLLEISHAIKQKVAQLKATLPDEIELSVWGDSSDYISERLNMLKGNAFQGLLLVFALLALFLNLKLAFWVAMGIPISIAGALTVMGSGWVDFSFNDVTTLGLIISLGILVDDAIVVGESVFVERKREKNIIKGTEKGVQRVAVATIYGALTTVAAFFPMMLIDNPLGKVLASFSGVVILALLFSLFESKFILPAHLAGFSFKNDKPQSWISTRWSSIQRFAQQKLEAFNQRVYAPVLWWCIKQRYAVLVIFISVAVFGMGLMGIGQIKTVFFPEIPGQGISVTMEMDVRAPYRLTVKNADHIEAIANQLNEELQSSYELANKPFKHILVSVTGSFSVEIYAELIAPEMREKLGTLTIMQQWQDKVGHLEGATKLIFSATDDETGGGFAIKLYSNNEQELRLASQELIANLRTIEGVDNLREELKNGKPELLLQLKPEARHLGFSVETLASQISERFGSVEAQRVQRDLQEVRVIVRDQEIARDSIADLMMVKLKSDKGKWYPLSSIANIQSAYVTDFIVREAGKRVNIVSARIDKSKTSPSEIGQYLFNQFIPDLKKRYPQLSISVGGELEQTDEIKGGMLRALLLTCLLIYALLAIPLKSYWQPLIIMSVIPFGLVGAAIGHLIEDLPFSILSFFGMLALTGVVVNDSLVMMTRYNQARVEGENVHDSLKSAGIGRFQAIFLTTATTVVGLMPLIQETSEQAQYLIPAAVSLAYGEIFATSMTLILIPVLIAIASDIKQFYTKQTPTIENEVTL